MTILEQNEKQTESQKSIIIFTHKPFVKILTYREYV